VITPLDKHCQALLLVELVNNSEPALPLLHTTRNAQRTQSLELFAHPWTFQIYPRSLHATSICSVCRWAYTTQLSLAIIISRVQSSRSCLRRPPHGSHVDTLPLLSTSSGPAPHSTLISDIPSLNGIRPIRSWPLARPLRCVLVCVSRLEVRELFLFSHLAPRNHQQSFYTVRAQSAPSPGAWTGRILPCTHVGVADWC
jgi:hypothetical protein